MLAKIYGHMTRDVIDGSKTWQGTPMFYVSWLIISKAMGKGLLANHTPLAPPTVKSIPVVLMRLTSRA